MSVYVGLCVCVCVCMCAYVVSVCFVCVCISVCVCIVCVVCVYVWVVCLCVWVCIYVYEPLKHGPSELQFSYRVVPELPVQVALCCPPRAAVQPHNSDRSWSPVVPVSPDSLLVSSDSSAWPLH